MKFSKLIGKVSVLAMVLSMSLSTAAFAETQTNIPMDVLKNADSLVTPTTVPEVKAWEIDLNGNKEEVTPLSKRISLMGPPNDGYIYVFDGYSAPSADRIWRYQNMGTFRFENNSSAPTNASYTQQTTTTSNWKVSVNISVNAEFKVAFLSKLTASVGGSWETGKTFTKGTSYGVSQVVPAKTTIYITAYAVGAHTSGTMNYRKYKPGQSSMVGYYQETAGGTAVSPNDVNIEITN